MLPLRGDLASFRSIQINRQWRIICRWQAADATEVRIVDYHRRLSPWLKGERMLPDDRVPTHPGEILRDQFLKPLGLTHVALAEHLGVPVQRIDEIVRGKRGVTSETAWLLAQAVDTTPEFWINLQTNHDLVVDRPYRSVPPLQKAG